MIKDETGGIYFGPLNHLGCKEGSGTYTYPNLLREVRSQWKGEFKENYANGKGEMLFLDGKKFTGFVKNAQLLYGIYTYYLIHHL